MQRVPGADAGFRVRGGASGVSRISARGVLKVRPHTKSGGGQSANDGGGETVRLRRGGGPAKAPLPPPGSYASETVTIVTKRVLKHFANELYLSFLILFIL